MNSLRSFITAYMSSGLNMGVCLGRITMFVSLSLELSLPPSHAVGGLHASCSSQLHEAQPWKQH